MLAVGHNLRHIPKELKICSNRRDFFNKASPTNDTNPRFPGRITWNRIQKRHLTDRFDNLVPKSLLPLWKSPAGPQTIFFWAPLAKWCLVLAGIADFTRHPSLISPSQAFSLVITGLIWCRYSVVIIPKNYMLLSVNAFVFLTQLYQLARWKVYDLQQNQKV
ncbi:unnamed protein product [Callosobruchus maculatus]|uniref:Mitochondrial pyruvate carrier n=1 Tax=Callosobruchus maculatus TaxID=64391 RepID=A0A653DFK2_CALMS|nr:unnamed protein product [Callosobruchus maculatus]